MKKVKLILAATTVCLSTVFITPASAQSGSGNTTTATSDDADDADDDDGDAGKWGLLGLAGLLGLLPRKRKDHDIHRTTTGGTGTTYNR